MTHYDYSDGTSNLVCPECGHDVFKATLTTRTEYTYNAHANAGLIERSEEVVDGGDVGDVDEFTCTDCGFGYDSLAEPDLITREAYEAENPGIEAFVLDFATNDIYR